VLAFTTREVTLKIAFLSKSSTILALSVALLLALLLTVAATPAGAYRGQDSGLTRSPFDGMLTGEAANGQSSLHPAYKPSVADGMGIGLEKQFEETSYAINDTKFISATLGWAVGEPHWDQTSLAYTATVLLTTDGGDTWNPQISPLVETLNGVDFIDENLGWAVGVGGLIVHTTDGGAHWTRQAVATSDEFRDVVFADPNQGWAVTTRPIHYDWSGNPDNWEAAIWHTANGGAAWSMQNTPADASILQAVEFVSDKVGWAVGVKYIGDDPNGYPQHRAVIYHTSNGGTNWAEQPYGGVELQVSLTTIDFLDTQHGWAAGFPTSSIVTGGFVFHTSDGGLTWERQEPGGFNDPLWDIHFINQNRGYVVGFNYVAAWGPPVWRTLDGGDTWEKVRMAQHENDGLFGLAINGDRVIALGDHDYQVVSDRPWDSCEWTPPEPSCYNCDCLFVQTYQNPHYQFQDVFFTDVQNGWAVGSRSFLPEIWGQVILATQDGGENWQVQYEQPPNLDTLFSYFRLDGVYFVDSQNGWAVGKSEMLSLGGGYHNAVLHTSDGGLTWGEQGSELHSSWDIELVDVKFLDAQNGWALANSHFPDDSVSLVHTNNGGQTWSWVDTDIHGYVMVGFGIVEGGVMFTDDQHGWATGTFGVAYTENGGTNWITQTLSQYLGNYFEVEFVNNQEGWVAGEGFYHTLNGGTLWEQQDLGLNSWFRDIQFVDGLHGWIAGDGGSVMRTTNGGSTWEQIFDPITTTTLNGISFIDSKKGWLVGDFGVILTTRQNPQVYLPLVTH
jgi:photosystem II stability/assembly factor-like uncharacterized protein